MLALLALIAVADPVSAGAVVETAPPAKPRSVLVLDLVASDVPPNTPRLLSGLLTDAVARSGLKTLAQEDLRRVVALAADREAAGCDTSSCLAEIANAMGVDYVVFGDVGKLGSAFIVTLRLFDANKNDAISRETIEASDLDGVRAKLGPAVDELMAPVGVAPKNPPLPENDPVPIGMMWPGIAMTTAGAVVGGTLGIWAVVLDADLGNPDVGKDAKNFALETGPMVVVGAGAGAALAAVGAGLVVASLMTGEGGE